MNATAACILGCEGTALRAAERSFFAETSPWGFILFALCATRWRAMPRFSSIRKAGGCNACVRRTGANGRMRWTWSMPQGPMPPARCICAPG
jgi:hypothetical protein